MPIVLANSGTGMHGRPQRQVCDHRSAMFALTRLANPYLLLTLTALFWSGNMIVGRAFSDELSPLALAFWRWILTLLLVLPFAWPHLRPQWPQLVAGWKAVAVMGVLSVSMYNVFAYLALRSTTATNASMLNSFIPLATLLFAAMFGRAMQRCEVAGLLVSLAGVLTIVSQGELARLLAFRFNPGDLWMLAAVLAWGLYTVCLQWRPQGVHPMLLLAAVIVVGLLGLTPFYLVETFVLGRSMTLDAASIGALLYLAVFPSFLGYVFYNAGVFAVGPARGALFIHLMPVFGTVLAALLLDEQPRTHHFFGIALVLCGIVLSARAPRKT